MQSKALLRCSAWGAIALYGSLTAQAQAQAQAQTETAGRIEDIVVTAQRVEETAQKAPIIISVIKGDDVAGVTDVRQLQNLDPGVQIAANGNIPNTFIRGIGSLNATLIQEASVAYNVDGVVLFTPTMITPVIFDLDRVEILKGPQGTLYGRNASAGVVNFITRGAKLGVAEGYVEGELGNFDAWRVSAAVNAPLTANFALRLAVNHAQHDGYLTDGKDDQDITSGRLRGLWQPSSTLSLKFGIDGSTIDTLGSGKSLSPNPTGIKWIGDSDPRALAVAPMLKAPPLPKTFFKNDQWSTFAQLDADLGFATLTVLPAYRSESSDQLIYNGLMFTEPGITHQKSLEARLSRQSGRLKWVAGAYYFKVDQNVTSGTVGELIGNGSTSVINAKVESYAFFGEATASLSDRLRVIGGLRYTHEKSHKRGQTNAFLAAPGVPVSPLFDPANDPGDYAFNAGTSRGAVTWKAGVEFDVAAESLLFATISRGFKGGGTFVDRPQVDTTFAPEFVTAYELGSRNRFFDNRLQVNAELFYWHLKGQQLPYLGVNSAGGVSFIIANAAKSRSYGGSLDITWKPTNNDSLHVGAEYLNAKYNRFVREMVAFSVQPNTACALTGYNPANPVSITTVDCSGLPALRAPKWSVTANYEHRFDLGGGDDITFDANMVYQSSRYLDAVYTDEFRQSGKAQYNASLTYNGFGKSLAVTGWIKNITDERIITGGVEQFIPIARVTVLPPRTYGVTVRQSF